MSTPEGALVKQIMAAIAKEYPKAWIFKTVGNPYQIAGVPDLIICVGGRFVALEVKARRSRESTEHALGRTTPRQVQTLEAIRQAGGVSAVVTSPSEAIREIVRSKIHAVYDQISSSWQTSPDAAEYMQAIEQALDAFQGEKEEMLNYTYRTTWSVEDGQFLGTCDEFPSLSWLADSQEAAWQGIRSLVSEVANDMARNSNE